MKVTKFDRKLWELSTFEKVGYDKETDLLILYLLDGSRIEFSEIEEEVVFHFIVSPNKEHFYTNILLQNYPYIQYIDKVSKPS